MKAAMMFAQLRKMPMFPLMPLLPLALLGTCALVSLRTAGKLSTLEKRLTQP